MLLNDLATLLQITIPEGQEILYQARLDAAINYAQSYCRTDFKNEIGKVELPSGVQVGVATMVQAMGEKQNVASQSLGDMSKSFFKNGSFDAAHIYLKPYRQNSVVFR